MTQPRLDALTTPSLTSTNHRVTRMTLMMLLDIVVEDSCAQSYFNRPDNHKVKSTVQDYICTGTFLQINTHAGYNSTNGSEDYWVSHQKGVLSLRGPLHQ